MNLLHKCGHHILILNFSGVITCYKCNISSQSEFVHNISNVEIIEIVDSQYTLNFKKIQKHVLRNSSIKQLLLRYGYRALRKVFYATQQLWKHKRVNVTFPINAQLELKSVNNKCIFIL